LELRDLSRIDIIVDKKNNAYVLEANSIPGFTETSLLPKAARSAGIEFDQLCLKLLNFALSRKTEKVVC
jgi:D-alanine-D-alanine ligase